MSRIDPVMVIIGGICVALIILVGLGVYYGGGDSCPLGYRHHSESKVTWGIDLTTGQYKPIMHTESYCLQESP